MEVISLPGYYETCKRMEARHRLYYWLLVLIHRLEEDCLQTI